MSEYIRVSLSETHAVDVEIPQWFLNSDDVERTKTREYVNSLSRATIEQIPHGERFAFVPPSEPTPDPTPAEPAPVVVAPSPFAEED